MDEEIETLLIGVRADTSGFSGDVAAMKSDLQGSLGDAASTAGGRIESALAKAVKTGKLGFDDLKQAALSALGAIETGAIRGGIGSILGGGGGESAAGGGGLLASAASLLSGLFGSPGRATGGPVSPGAAYRVGENGPELFVPTSAGRVESGFAATPASASRDVRVAITINSAGNDAPGALARSGKQVARAVRDALNQAGG